MMTGLDTVLLRRLLGITGDWEISEYRIDPVKRHCGVWVRPAVARGWFGRPRTPPPRTEEHVWQHLSLGVIRFVLHASLPAGAEVQRLPWTGDRGMPFTHALAQQVFLMFNEGMDLAAICKLLNLSLADVWRYRFAIDNGLVHSEGGSGRPEVAALAARAIQKAAVADPPVVRARSPAAAAVPDVTDPVWQKLAFGEIEIDIRVLSLKLMLTKVRSQLDVISDDEVRLLKLRDLHRYFVKNERQLGHELSQLRAS